MPSWSPATETEAEKEAETGTVDLLVMVLVTGILMIGIGMLEGQPAHILILRFHRGNYLSGKALPAAVLGNLVSFSVNK